MSIKWNFTLDAGRISKHRQGGTPIDSIINVSKAYKQHNVLENINLSINEGELVVLIGLPAAVKLLC